MTSRSEGDASDWRKQQWQGNIAILVLDFRAKGKVCIRANNSNSAQNKRTVRRITIEKRREAQHVRFFLFAIILNVWNMLSAISLEKFALFFFESKVHSSSCDWLYKKQLA